jgi:Zn-dependent protease with chaperone function
LATISSSNPFAEGVERFCSKLILSDERFEALSQQAARDLKENRAAYFQRVMLMAALGYGYILSVISLMIWGVVAITVAMFQNHYLHIGFLKILLLLGLFAYGMLRSLWLKSPPPEGIKVTREDAPALFELIDKFKTELNTKVDVVMVNDDFNAFVTQIPRLGFLGLHTNYLVLGLPLMAALNANQFSAVLAHELGHLSGNHSKRAAWVYGLRARWSSLLINMRQESPLAFAIFYVFFSWLAPRFNAYTMALARAQELDADKDAERIAGSGNVASSLVLVRLKGRYLDEVWTSVTRKAIDSPTPVEGIYNEVTESMRSLPVENVKAQDWLKKALAERGSGMDTHPPLCERLGARGCLHDYQEISDQLLNNLKEPIPKGETAAEVFLGSALPKYINQLSEQWHKNVTAFWTDKFEFFKTAKERLAELDRKAESEELSLEDMKEKAYYISEMQGMEGCRPLLEEILQKFPDDPLANYTVGVTLLDEGNEEGVALLEKAMDARLSMVSQCVAALTTYLEPRGRVGEVAKYDGKMAEFRQASERAEKERNGVNGKDALKPHSVSEAWIDVINLVMPHFKNVEYAYLVEKEVQTFPEYPYLVLAIDTKGSGEEKLELARWLIGNLQLPDPFCVITFDRDTKKLKENILKIKNSMVYSKYAPREIKDAGAAAAKDAEPAVEPPKE